MTLSNAKGVQPIDLETRIARTLPIFLFTDTGLLAPYLYYCERSGASRPVAV